MTSVAKTSSSIDLSKRDLTLDLARVFCVLLVVVIHLLFVGVGRDASGALIVSRPVEGQAWFAAATWVGQIMPLFFVVGGFASLTAWRSLRRRDGTASDYVRNRVLRLAQPAFPLFIFYAAVLGVAMLLRVDPALLSSVATGAGSPLWFLAAYTLCQAFVPIMAGFHERTPKAAVVLLLAGAILVDVLRYSTGVVEFGLINLLFVWLLVQQLGFWYADGWFDRRSWWQLLVIAAVSYAALVPMTTIGPYSTNMLIDLNPPTLPLVALAVGQACLLRLLRPALASLMRTRGAKALVFMVGSRLMTIYLWHLPLIIILAGVSLLIPGASPQPASAAWWWSRPIVYVIVLAALLALSFLVGRWEAPREVGVTPPGAIVGAAALLTFIPSFLIMERFLNFWFAVIGAALSGVAILVLGRWRAAGTRPTKS
jgi:hypothetical protein